MSDKGRRASERRRQREGEEALDVPDGEQTDVHMIDAEWVGDESGLIGGEEDGQLEEYGLSAGEYPGMVSPTGEMPASSIVDESERVSGGAVEATAMAARPRIAKATGASVMVMAGADKGCGQDLIFAEMVVGRSDRCDLVLRDTSVSREHLAIRFVNEAFEVVDLGSESGTLVNGQEVRRSPLEHGDEVELGETILRFMVSEGPRPGERPPEEEEEEAVQTAVDPQVAKPKKKRSKALTIIVVAGVVLILLGAIGAAATVYYLNAVGQLRVSLDPALEALLNKARRELKAGNYPEALIAAQAFLQSRPYDVEALSIVKEANKQLALLDKLAEIKRLIRQGDLAKAQELVDSFDQESPLFKGARALLDSALEERRVASLDAVRRLMDDGHLAAAENLLDKHEKRFPEDEEAASLRAEVANMREGIHSGKVQAARKATNKALIPSSKAFARGELGTARDMLHKLYGSSHGRAAKKMESSISAFQKAWAAGQRAHRQKQADAGLKSLARAAQIDREISPGGSAYTHKISKLAADLHYQKGVGKMSRGDGCGARKSFVKARALKPSDTKNKEQLDRLAHQAEALFNKAKKLGKSDRSRAKKIARQASCLVAPSSSTGRKIKAFLR